MLFDFSFLIYAFFYPLIIVLIILILLDNRETYQTISWVLLVTFLPILGLILFFLFGRNWRPQNKRRKIRNAALFKSASQLLKDIYDIELFTIKEANVNVKVTRFATLMKLAFAAPFMFPVKAEEIRLYTNGAKKFEDLITDIENAEKYIHIEYYIIRSDDLTDRIIKALCAKARQGVEVRIFYDYLGSISWKNKDKRKLRDAGAKVYSGKAPLDKINYRSHRKIISIDGSIAYIGGMNMSKWYVSGNKKFDHWRDNHLRITGNFAIAVEVLFAHYWYTATKEQLLDAEHVTTKNAMRLAEGKIVQLIHSGADTEWNTISQTYQKLISLAEKYIWLETPYFMPQENIFSSLINAALSGVEVNLILAGVSDNFLSRNASFTYFKELLTAGANIFLYTEGFMHGKAMSIDGKICTVGSANLDPRSMEINYEANVVIYNQEFTLQLEQEFVNDLNNCRKVSLADMENAGILKRFKWSVCRLLSPLL
ncbi:MAG TPA: cardiolipin synthase [Ignavibacteriaceae bacterium]|nr:cardiolipin synthase [Ignavibacteriaceae bacterium]